MKKFRPLFFLILISLIIPQVSFAVWWKPFTWKIFNKAPAVQVETKTQSSEIEKLKSEVAELKKKTQTSAVTSQKPSTAVTDKSKATIKPVIPATKPTVSATELKKDNPQQYKTLVDENKTKLLEASKLLSNKNIIVRVKPSVVYIETTSGSGSGVVVSADGYVLTNAHVVSGTDSATVKLASGASYNGVVVGRDENIDLALLKISASGLSAAFLGDSDLVEQGDSVFAFGYPLGIEGDVAFKDGTLSRRQKINGTIYLEISAQILPGNSGGPLVNQAGEVVGINTLSLGTNKIDGVLIGETLKYALPINTANTLIPELKNGRNILNPTQGFRKNAETEIQTPPSTTFCNGTNWSHCPTGQDFVCPSTGSAYCQFPTNNKDYTTGTVLKSNTIDFYNKLVIGLTSLNTFYTTDINNMNDILKTTSGESNELSNLISTFTTVRLTRVVKSHDLMEQLQNEIRSNKEQLQAQPVSYFLNYQIPSVVYNISNDISGWQSNAVADANSYSEYIKNVYASSRQNVPSYDIVRCKEIEAQPIASSFINAQKAAANCP